MCIRDRNNTYLLDLRMIQQILFQLGWHDLFAQTIDLLTDPAQDLKPSCIRIDPALITGPVKSILRKRYTAHNRIFIVLPDNRWTSSQYFSCQMCIRDRTKVTVCVFTFLP